MGVFKVLIIIVLFFSTQTVLANPRRSAQINRYYPNSSRGYNYYNGTNQVGRSIGNYQGGENYYQNGSYQWRSYKTFNGTRIQNFGGKK